MLQALLAIGGEGHDSGLPHLDGQLDDALVVRGLRAQVDLRALDLDPDAADRLAVLGQADRQRGLAPDEELLRVTLLTATQNTVGGGVC